MSCRRRLLSLDYFRLAGLAENLGFDFAARPFVGTGYQFPDPIPAVG